MPAEPVVKRAIAFIDGQNLFHNARGAFGYSYPNYDVQRLAQAVCASKGWMLSGVQFYTGVPSLRDDSFWNRFWSNKLAIMGRRGVTVYSRPLVYRNKTIQAPGFGPYTFPSGEEKGIDVRLALDALDAAHRNRFDVAIIQHLAGNMRSRWTNFLHSDGEKPQRDRDTEFVERPVPRDQIMLAWSQGWDCLLATMSELSDADLSRTVTVRDQPMTVAAAIARQLCHYGWHVGQILLLAKHLRGQAWQYVTIPPGQTHAYHQARAARNRQ